VSDWIKALLLTLIVLVFAFGVAYLMENHSAYSKGTKAREKCQIDCSPNLFKVLNYLCYCQNDDRIWKMK